MATGPVRNHQIVQKILAANQSYKKTSKKPVLEKVKLVVKVIFSTLLSIVLFWINPATFFISFVVGVAFNQVDKIKTFMLHYKWVMVAGCAIMAVLALPVFIATSSVIWSAYMGSYLMQKAQKNQQLIK
jgi:hypothetical protein